MFLLLGLSKLYWQHVQLLWSSSLHLPGTMAWRCLATHPQIASIVSLLGDEALLHDMQRINPKAGEREFTDALSGRRYVLFRPPGTPRQT